MEKNKKIKVIVNIALIILFLAIIVFAAVKFGPQITRLANDPKELKATLNSYGWKSALVFMLIQLVQVVVAAIPGEFVQIAGGYIYGSFAGTLYSLAGIVAGSIIVFFVSRLLGYPLVRTFVSQKNLDKFEFMMNNEKSDIVMFLLFLIPGLPKDILTYIAGLTPVKPLKFFVIITLGRFPALLASSIIGSNIEKGNYTLVIILSVIALILFVAGLLLKDKIISVFHGITRKQ